jgi:hypothetical protein
MMYGTVKSVCGKQGKKGRFSWSGSLFLKSPLSGISYRLFTIAQLLNQVLDDYAELV